MLTRDPSEGAGIVQVGGNWLKGTWKSKWKKFRPVCTPAHRGIRRGLRSLKNCSKNPCEIFHDAAIFTRSGPNGFKNRKGLYSPGAEFYE
jgi:hypothetical protein